MVIKPMPSTLDYPFSPRQSLRDMRTQHLKLKKGKSTKAERRFMEILKELRIPFKTKVDIAGEVDFLIGRYAIEINGHEQNIIKNSLLIEAGYEPVHYDNADIAIHREEIKLEIKKLWQENETQS